MRSQRRYTMYVKHKKKGEKTMRKIWEIVKGFIGIVLAVWLLVAVDNYYVKKTHNKSILKIVKKEVVEFVKCAV